MSKKCLIVDDVEVSRYVIGNHMEELGFTVSEAEDLDQAQEMMKKDRFDVVFLDWHLRQKNDLAKSIPALKKAMGSMPAPIVVCSGVEQGDLVEQVKKMGGQGFIGKPSTLGDISALLNKLGIL